MDHREHNIRQRYIFIEALPGKRYETIKNKKNPDRQI
jgi:hypothetical protein